MKKEETNNIFQFLMHAIKNYIKQLLLIRKFVQSKSWFALRHKMLLLVCDRNNYTETRFLRIPTQYSALSGPVIDFLVPEHPDDMLKIIVAGCSTGQEVYSIASVLKCRRPNLSFEIRAFDIDRNVIAKAKKATYEKNEVFKDNMVTQEFLNDTFDLIQGLYKVKTELLDHVSFIVADAISSDLKKLVGTADILFAQNFLFHMKRKLAKKAFGNLCGILNAKSALFIEGIDLDIRVSLTRKYGLVPLLYNIEQIHEEARQLKGSQWPWIYWGLEPFSKQKKDYQRRYSTIFLQSA